MVNEQSWLFLDICFVLAGMISENSERELDQARAVFAFIN